MTCRWRLVFLCLLLASVLGVRAGAHPASHQPDPMPNTPLYLPAHDWDAVEALPGEWFWGGGNWRFAKRLVLENKTDDERFGEPVEVEVDFHVAQITDLSREVRVVRVLSGGGGEEQPSQVCCEVTEDDTRRARLFFLADVPARGRVTYLVFYGNPEAPEPAYETDLSVAGEGYALQVENRHLRAVLAPTNGNLKSLYPKQGTASFVGSGPPMMGGHGVEGTIHWGPDWSDERVGRYRLTNWDGPNRFDYDVARGPVVVRVRRWGHPILSIGPDVGRPHRVLASVTYTFFAGQPYVLMESKLEVLEETRFRDCRNDEWVIGGDLPEVAWMSDKGAIGFGAKGWHRHDPLWLTFYDRHTGQGFGSLHLAFENSHPSWQQPETVAIQANGIWVRYPVRHATMRSGDFVYERNAYLLHRFEEGGRDAGFGDLMDHQRRLTKPLTQIEAPPATKPLSVANVTDALRATNDFELYIQGNPWDPRQLSVVDLGLVRHVAVDGDDVRLDLVMPYAGRETWFGWFAARVEEQIRQRLADVSAVDVNLVRQPAWSPKQMNDRARRFIGSTSD